MKQTKFEAFGELWKNKDECLKALNKRLSDNLKLRDYYSGHLNSYYSKDIYIYKLESVSRAVARIKKDIQTIEETE